MPTLALVRPFRTCPAWCTRHDDEADVCSAEPIRLDFAPAMRGGADDACVILASSTDGTTIHMGMDGTGYALSVAGTEALAIEMLAKVAAARNGGTR